MTSVLVDGRALYGNSRFSGIGTYVRCLLDSLAERSDISVAALVTDEQQLPAGIERVRVRRRAPERFAGVELDVLLPRDIRRKTSDVYHSPSYDPPARVDRPWVQTVHDIIPLVVADPWFAPERQRWHRRLARIRRADLVIADSQSTADDIVRLGGVDSDRVRVVSLGVAASFRPNLGPTGTDAPYVVAVSEFGPHKGFRELFEVAARLADAGSTHRLKVVGRVHPALRRTFDDILASSRRPDVVDVVGYVSDHALVRLYQNASAMLVASRYEGFGLPAVEAMACGTPVVAFANSSLVEVVGDGGLLVSDGDVTAMVDATLTVLADATAADSVGQRGVERAATFTWARCADETVAVYNELR
jgi:alpha-1,3-rhamnosyl/mannosyltransferase